MVRVSDLTDGYYYYDDNHYEMVNERTGKTYKLGQTVKVIVLATDRILRTIDFKMADDNNADNCGKMLRNGE